MRTRTCIYIYMYMCLLFLIYGSVECELINRWPSFGQEFRIDYCRSNRKKSFTDGSILSVVSMSDSSSTDLHYLSIADYAQLRLNAQGIFFLLYHLEKILMTPTRYFNSNILTWSRCIIFLNIVLAPSPLCKQSHNKILCSPITRISAILRRPYEYWFRQLEILV